MAKILKINKCWDCHYHRNRENLGLPDVCWEPKRVKKNKGMASTIVDAMVVDTGCLLQDAEEPITELISIEELEDILNSKKEG